MKSLSSFVRMAGMALILGVLAAGCVSDNPASDPSEATFPEIERWWK